jgi:CheY-like chemotaxis protein
MTSKILVVDDEKHILELARLYLTREGYEVEGVGDGAQAVARFTQVKPDLVILDIMLPGVDGLTICKEIRKQSQVPIIGMVENMAGYACPHCGEVSDPFGSGGAEAAAKVMEIPFLGRIPLKLEIRRASDAGSPPAAGEGEEAALFRELAGKLLAQLGQRAGGFHAAHA